MSSYGHPLFEKCDGKGTLKSHNPRLQLYPVPFVSMYSLRLSPSVALIILIYSKVTITFRFWKKKMTQKKILMMTTHIFIENLMTYYLNEPLFHFQHFLEQTSLKCFIFVTLTKLKIKRSDWLSVNIQWTYKKKSFPKQSVLPNLQVKGFKQFRVSVPRGV